MAQWNVIGHGLFAAEPIGNLFLSARRNIWNSKVVFCNKTTCLLKCGYFNREPWVVNPVWYYNSMFPCTFFSVITMLEKSTLFPLIFFDVISIVEKSSLLPRSFFQVISLIEISTVFLLTFFDVILMAKKSTLFASTFLDKVLMNSTS